MLSALVAAGHDPYCVMGYTLAQVRWWSAAVNRREAQTQANAIIAARMVWADGKDVRRVLRSLGAG